MSVYPSEQAPTEKSANHLCLAFIHRIAEDEGAFDRYIDRWVRTQERAERRAKAARLLARRNLLAHVILHTISIQEKISSV